MSRTAAAPLGPFDAALSAASIAASSEEVTTTAFAQSRAARSMRGEPSRTSASASKAAFVRGSGAPGASLNASSTLRGKTFGS